MKYMMLINSAATPETSPAPASGDGPTADSFEDWMVYDKAVKDAGIWVSGHSLADLTTATTLRIGPDGDRIVTDGPFAETREILGGYYVIDVPDLDVALDWAARCPGAYGGGSIVVRPIADFQN